MRDNKKRVKRPKKPVKWIRRGVEKEDSCSQGLNESPRKSNWKQHMQTHCAAYVCVCKNTCINLCV